MPTPDPAFFDVPTQAFATDVGEVSLPISYFRTNELIALFSVDEAAARAAIADQPLDLVTVGGKARAALVFFEYLDTSIGPYNEVGLATLTTPKGQKPPLLPLLDLMRPPRKRQLGMHVLKLPVTTAIANAAGRELWGFPKFVTPIDVSLTRKHFAARVADPDAPDSAILEMAGALPMALPVPPVELMLLPVKDGNLLRTVVDVRGGHHLVRGRGLTLKLGDSQHPMAAQMRALGMDGLDPDVCIYTRGGYSLLHAGEPVASHAASPQVAAAANAGGSRSAA